MNTDLEYLVSQLPEIYQTIYGHNKWADASSRDCNVRLGLITEQYCKLEKVLGRPLRVLDLGCAQGFFSLSLAALGATVRGVDFLPANIKVCQALAAENPTYKCTFEVGRIEDIIKTSNVNDYNLVIGLSVFHHIVHEHGLEQVKQWLKHLGDCTEIIIMELALREEPLYWGNSLPENPADLIDYCSFYRLIGEFETHLSMINRPMYVISNKRVVLDNFVGTFNSWRKAPHNMSDSVPHEGTRRYYFGDSFVCKKCTFPTRGGVETFQSKRNRTEIMHEAEFLSKPPAAFKAPQLIESKINRHDGWLAMERIQGSLLCELLAEKHNVNIEKVLKDILTELVILENEGLYHDDIRTWNIIYDSSNDCYRLIDYGSISEKKKDCGWPYDPILSFFVFINEIIQNHTDKKVIWRKGYINPFTLPPLYQNWLGELWRKPVEDWNFALVAELFEIRHTLPNFSASIPGAELWVVAQEQLAIDMQNLGLINSERVDHLSATSEESFRQIAALRQELLNVKEQYSSLQRLNSALINISKLKIIKPFRYISTQLKLLRQHGLKKRIKHLVKRLLLKVAKVFQANHNLKNFTRKILYKTGTYNLAFKIYRRMFPVLINTEDSDVWLDSKINAQLNSSELVPEEVAKIHKMIKKNN